MLLTTIASMSSKAIRVFAKQEVQSVSNWIFGLKTQHGDQG